MTAETQTVPETITAWHRIVETKDPALLDALVADDCVFRSPAVHTPQEGKAVTIQYLTAAMVVLGPTLTYRREWYADDSAVLQFEAVLDGLTVDGIDMITWGEDGRITEFAVMVRPVKALHKLMELMAARAVQRSKLTPASSRDLSQSAAASASSLANRLSFAGPTGPRHSPIHVDPV